MNSTERNDMRKVLFDAWQKYTKQLPLEPLETQLIDIILWHPEYHDLLNQPELYLDKDFDETNPILHLGLHLAVRDQVNTNRPPDIQAIFQQLCHKLTDPHQAEHILMDCLSHFLWEMQQTSAMPNDADYLEYLKRIS